MKSRIKAIISVVFILVLTFAIAGCGKADIVSEKTSEYIKEAISVAEQYLNGRITTDEAGNKLENLSDLVQEEALKYKDDDARSDFYYYGVVVTSDIYMLGFKIRTGNISEVENRLSDLKDYID
ncbi:MAG: hypothetical protein J5441_03510 [Clostridia bacterium]|nr:hypothetical protein [Clostridia bacterium]